MGALTGKSALVTGGSRGIGAAIAKRLAKEGADVAITYSSSPERAQQVVDDIVKAGGKAVAINADARIRLPSGQVCGRPLTSSVRSTSWSTTRECRPGADRGLPA
jgi:NAD(P)-dependent dehydrogenase (short-subunit alcohol dehydrogenase family)